MKIEIYKNKNGVLECRTHCLFYRECANHITAGDFRTEDGFTPEISFKKHQFECRTADKKAIDDVGVIQLLPEGYNSLTHGMLMMNDDGTFKVCELNRW